MSTSIVHINDELFLEDLAERLDEKMFSDREIEKIIDVVKDLLGL